MGMIESYFDLWEAEVALTGSAKNHVREQMKACLENYLYNNYPDVTEDKMKIIYLKRDFESDLLPITVAKAVGCDVELVNRYRHTHDRGVIKTGKAERGAITAPQRTDILERDDYECVRCGVPAYEQDLQLHHIIPKKAGGSDYDENLAHLCMKCHVKAHCGDFSLGKVSYGSIQEFWRDFAE